MSMHYLLSPMTVITDNRLCSHTRLYSVVSKSKCNGKFCSPPVEVVTSSIATVTLQEVSVVLYSEKQQLVELAVECKEQDLTC